MCALIRLAGVHRTGAGCQGIEKGVSISIAKREGRLTRIYPSIIWVSGGTITITSRKSFFWRSLLSFLSNYWFLDFFLDVFAVNLMWVSMQRGWAYLQSTIGELPSLSMSPVNRAGDKLAIKLYHIPLSIRLRRYKSFLDDQPNQSCYLVVMRVIYWSANEVTKALGTYHQLVHK